MNIAKTILEQLGGNRFAAMTGANNLLNLGNGLSMKVMQGWYVKVLLEPSDTYTMEIFKLRKHNRVNETIYRDVYAEDLAPLFTEKTGLVTHI